MRRYSASCDDDVTRGGCGDHFWVRVVSVYVVSCCHRVIIVGTVSGGATMESARSERR